MLISRGSHGDPTLLSPTQVALTCVKNAERTLTDFLDFLKTDKYKVWNDEQQTKREELLKSMIGEEPKGKPHASGIKEDDIELVEAEKEDIDGRIGVKVKNKEDDVDEDGDEDGEEEEDDDEEEGENEDDDEPKNKRKKAGNGEIR